MRQHIAKLSRVAYQASKSGIFFTGIVMVAIYSVMSMAYLKGVPQSSGVYSPDFYSTTSGFYAYFWITLFWIYGIGLVISTIHQVINNKRSKQKDV